MRKTRQREKERGERERFVSHARASFDEKENQPARGTEAGEKFKALHASKKQRDSMPLESLYRGEFQPRWTEHRRCYDFFALPIIAIRGGSRVCASAHARTYMFAAAVKTAIAMKRHPPLRSTENLSSLIDKRDFTR